LNNLLRDTGMTPPQQMGRLRFELLQESQQEQILPQNLNFDIWKKALGIGRKFLGPLIPTKIDDQPWLKVGPVFIPRDVALIPISYIIMQMIVPYFKRTPLDRLRARNEAGEMNTIDLSIGKPLPFQGKENVEILRDIIARAESVPFPRGELKLRVFKSDNLLGAIGEGIYQNKLLPKKVKDIFGSNRPTNWQDKYMADTVEPFMEKYSKYMTFGEKYNEISRFVISGQAYHQNFDQRLYIPFMGETKFEDLLILLSDEADRIIQTPNVYKVSNPDSVKFWAIFEAVPYRYRKALHDHFQFTYEDMEDARELLNRKDFIGTLDKDEFLADEMPKYEQETIDNEHSKDVRLGTETVPSLADYRYLKLSKLAYKVNGMNKDMLMNDGEIVNTNFNMKNTPLKPRFRKVANKTQLIKIDLDESMLANEFNISNPEYYTDGDRDFILIKDKNKNIFVIGVAGSKTNPSEAGFARDWKTNIFGTFQHRATKIMNLLEPMLADNQEFYISGHSLGSATGNLLALRVGRRYNSKIHYVGFATPGCILTDKLKLYTETLKNGLFKNYYIYNDIVGKLSIKMVVPEHNNFVLYKNGWKEVGLESTFFNQMNKVIATVRDNAHSIDLYHKYLRIAVKRGEIKGDTYESKQDILLDFDRGVFLEKHPDIDPPILSRLLNKEVLLRKRINIVRKMNPRKSAEEILDIVIYDEAIKVKADREKQEPKDFGGLDNFESRKDKFFPEEGKKTRATLTDFSKSIPNPESFDWLSFSKTVSNLFTGKDEL